MSASVRRKCCWIAMMLAAAPLSLLGETLRVAPNADGRFTDLASVIDAAHDGDTILLSSGRYQLRSSLYVNKQNLKIIGIAGQRPVLSTGDDIPAVIHIVANGVQLQDLILQGGFYGVKIEPEDESKPLRGVTIRNCTISSTAADGIKSYLADDLLIEYTQIGPTGLKQQDNAEGIDIIGSIKVRVRGCVIDRASTNGIYLKGGTRDGIVERCLIREAGNGGILLGQDTDPEYMRDHAHFEAIDCIARNNIIIGTRTAGLGTYSGQNIAFLNNTLIDTASIGQASIWIVTNERSVPAENVTVQNNIIAGTGARPAMFIKDAAGLPDSDHNLFWARDGKVRVVREVSADETLNREWSFEQWREAGHDANSRVGDPAVDLLRYRPAASSPVVGAGVKQPQVSEDYYGRPRSQWDIGAVAAGGDPAVAATLPAR